MPLLYLTIEYFLYYIQYISHCRALYIHLAFQNPKIDHYVDALFMHCYFTSLHLPTLQNRLTYPELKPTVALLPSKNKPMLKVCWISIPDPATSCCYCGQSDHLCKRESIVIACGNTLPIAQGHIINNQTSISVAL